MNPTPKSAKILIMGASTDPSRYSNRAFHRLREAGYESIFVSPHYTEIEKRPCYPSIRELPQTKIDTVTMYVRAEISDTFAKDLVALKPRRVIFNPGSENAKLEKELRNHKIEVLEACTLVLLSTHQF